ncbi:MAG: SGNH/GDSL hydrolase family protein, partial [Planctomycetota bacterium]|nr:SGNH/GDSL hydrolase family protein [Planctomycetota bacterium]
MIRSLANWFKHLCYAVLFLALLACLMEIGLRVYDSATGQLTRCDLYDRGLTCKSWTAHHELKPSRAYLVRNPDTDQKIRVNVNSFGLRGREPALPKPAGTLRVLCLGDDSTFASHVVESETFCARLQARLSEDRHVNVEVINAGIPDYCPLLSYLQLRKSLLALAPDLVILNFDMSDISDDHAVRWFVVSDADGTPTSCAHPGLEMPRSAAKPGTFDALLLPQWARQQANSFLSDQTSRVATSSIDFPRSKYLWLAETPPDWEDYIQQAFSPLSLIQDLLAGQETRFVVTAIPAPWQVSTTATSGGGVRERAGVPADGIYRSHRPFELIEEFCRKHDITFCDIAPTFQSQQAGQRLYLRNVAEFSAEGHALYADDLASFLAEEWTGPRALPRNSPGDYA